MKYLRVKEAVLRELAKPQPGFPLSENQLSQRFGVSRMTARRALQELEREGYLSRQQGKGSFPAERRFSQGFLRVRPFYEFAAVQGAVPRTQVLVAEPRPAPPEVAEKLGTADTLCVRRLRFLDEEPVILETRYLDAARCGAVLEHDLTAESLHDILVHVLGLPLTRVWQRLEAVALDPEVAALLAQPAGAPGLRLERVTYTLQTPVTWVEYLMRGDRYFFEDTFTPQGERP
ncbi:transcriptional regulator, GntR family [Allomeiothermus silvanus DSM 9946]|uniref:Transcriptional regulator, GntR family n=1 Tax=Allomeiothermus silvanus (strain ATCC 700542 / DSM 9946 / NBRC 106475 / NCIMB 13440 / VI-R2) TaxID=526227 RepID=D7BFG8_ALLS1|nr:GntR family transcriptional regulator [Allomeiothermus silvanus]ADH63521.1 transcriptional regulator, GntR family [Allomeiothermus silvanus DSM 9946]